MGNMRTLVFQAPEELFHKVKEYLQRNNMTQKNFVIGLIETEIERDLTQRAAVAEGQTESVAVSDCEDNSEEVEEEIDEQESTDFEDDKEEQDESENQGNVDGNLGEQKPLDSQSRKVFTGSALIIKSR